MLLPLMFSAWIAPAAPAMGVEVCPADHKEHRAVATWFASSPDYAAERDVVTMPALDSAAVRVLAGPADSAACERLSALVAPGGEIGPTQLGPYAFYGAGDYYLVVASPVAPPDQLALGWSVVVVLDSELCELGSFVLQVSIPAGRRRTPDLLAAPGAVRERRTVDVGVSLRCAPGRAARAVGNDTTVASGAQPPPR